MTNCINIDIAICTFRRVHICETLKSLSHITVPNDCNVRIIVADNDDKPSSKKLIENCTPLFEYTYIHAPARNISIARNACLDVSKAPILLFIDDDETVTINWLVEMLNEQRQSGAEVIMGPAIAIYPLSAPDWMRNGDHHTSRPHYVDGVITTGYIGNTLLMRASPSISGLRFKEELGRSGGEDTYYLATVYRRGGKISYAPKAVVNEEVPPHRASLSWLLKRRYRTGHNYGQLLHENIVRDSRGTIFESSMAGSKFLYCLFMSILNLPSRTKSVRWLLRGALHAGVFAKYTGIRAAEVYGQDQSV